VISRADMAAQGVPRSTVDGWYRDRATTGHPEKAGRIGRTDYWFEDEWTAWHETYLRRKAGSLTRPDRGGDPDDLVDATGAARILGWANRNVVHGNRRLGYFPEPDAYGRRAPSGDRQAHLPGHAPRPAPDRPGPGGSPGRHDPIPA
jgi:hypothetical protein